MNPALYEQLGVRNSLGAFAALLVAAVGVATLLLSVWSLAREGVSDPSVVFAAAWSAVVAVGRSTEDSLDALAGIAVTVLLGSYVAIIGGQFSPGLDVVSLRVRLSTAGLVLAACFCGVAAFRIVALVTSGAVGAVLVAVLETIIIMALAIELSSWILLSRQRQLEQNQRAIDRSRMRIRQAVSALDRRSRKHPILSSVGAVVITAMPSLLLAVLSPGAEWLFVPFVLGLVLGTHVTFLIVEYARVAEGLRWLSWTLMIVPAVFGLLIVLSGLQLIAAGLPLAGAAVLSSFLVVAVANLFAPGTARTALSLRHLGRVLQLV